MQVFFDLFLIIRFQNREISDFCAKNYLQFISKKLRPFNVHWLHLPDFEKIESQYDWTNILICLYILSLLFLKTTKKFLFILSWSLSLSQEQHIIKSPCYGFSQKFDDTK